MRPSALTIRIGVRTGGDERTVTLAGVGSHELDPDTDEACARLARSLAPPPTEAELRTVFRPSVGARGMYVASFLIMVGLLPLNLLGVLNPGKAGGTTMQLLGWVLIPVWGVIVWRAAFVQRVAFNGGELVIVNVFRRHRIPLTAIALGSNSAGRFGTVIGYRSPGTARLRFVTAAAAQTSPADRLLARRHAEDFVHLIERAAAQAQGIT
jgi:hypothetical protein